MPATHLNSARHGGSPRHPRSALISTANICCAMTVTETLLVFAGVPAAVIAFVALCVYGPARSRRAPRYRPGMPLEFSPVWFLAPSDSDGSGRAVRVNETEPRLALTASRVPTEDFVGGARASW